jgi:hypothetical protein
MMENQHDIETIQSLPNDWFNPAALTEIDCSELRCEKLAAQGYLEKKKDSVGVSTYQLYRKVQLNSPDKNPFKECDYLHGITRLVLGAEERCKMVDNLDFFDLTNIVRDYISVPVQQSVKKRAQQRLSEWPKDEEGNYIVE